MTDALSASDREAPAHVRVPERVRAAVIGGGPAGLMAAEALLVHGIAADVYDAMPSLGRKMLMAGKSGLNLTFAEPMADFLARYTCGVTGGGAGPLAPILESFGPDAVRAWAAGLGVETFVGSSGRVFPSDMKAAPLLRAWLRRLRAGGVRIHARHPWRGWDDDGALAFDTRQGPIALDADATVLALGGASWPQLGANAAWVPWLAAHGVAITPFRPSNCGFDAKWSEYFVGKHQGHPLKGVALTFQGRTVTGDVMVTRTGLEGGPVYALSTPLVRAIKDDGPVAVHIDLAPDMGVDALAQRLANPRGKKSFATYLKRATALSGAKASLLREARTAADLTAQPPDALARLIKAVPVTLTRPRPLADAISSAGGIAWSAVGEDLELDALPDTHVVGEMLDWDAPTGGYLLTACLATGKWAGDAVGRKLTET